MEGMNVRTNRILAGAVVVAIGAGGVAAVVNGQWAATFTYPTGAAEALELARKILIDCAESVPASVTVPTQAVTPENAKTMLNQ